jgi:hypothetical protein
MSRAVEEHPGARVQDEAPAATGIDDDRTGYVRGVDDEIEQHPS